MAALHSTDYLMQKELEFGIQKINKRDVSYESAVYHLNSLQSNAMTIKNMRERRNCAPEMNLAETAKYLDILGIEQSAIDKLNIVYVSGTKGKGSTCAFTESILRQLGFKTGFYSSPHLVHVRERIRINSIPISEEQFAGNFFEIYDKLRCTDSDSGRPMPAYFKFLTLMAFHVFIKENVDVAVVEVGIGGEYDCTNVIKNPVVCGITTLDYDHTSILGNTLAEIAWHKAGIMKENSVTVCVDQPTEAVEVIQTRAAEKRCQLFFAPDINAYKFPEGGLENRLPGHHQTINLSLALQLVRVWLGRTGNSQMVDVKDVDFDEFQKCSVLPGYSVPESFTEGLKKCSWKGRGQIVQKDGFTYYLDGAHTPKSIQLCADWYKSLDIHEELDQNQKPIQILIFTCTADRNPLTLLPSLKDCNFDQVLFTTTRLKLAVDKHLDSTNLNASDVEQREKCLLCRQLWTDLTGKDNSKVSYCISDALKTVHGMYPDNKNVHILVTGSLHLVGGVLNLLDLSG